jgi:glutamate-1-semialdehyde 2,1-aminomutase/spore coat polysaccharide biosynthesis protein SpsF
MIGVTPDLICLGKAMGNGMPISVVGGSTDIMECDEYFVSSTFAGETLSIVAAQKTIEQLQTPSFDLHHLWNKGEYFVKEFNKLGPVKITGYPTRGVFEADLYTKALFWQEACMAGILFGPSWFFNFPHIEHIDKILSVCKDIMTRINTNSVKLIGALPQPPFSQRARNV